MRKKSILSSTLVACHTQVTNVEGKKKVGKFKSPLTHVTAWLRVPGGAASGGHLWLTCPGCGVGGDPAESTPQHRRVLCNS